MEEAPQYTRYENTGHLGQPGHNTPTYTIHYLLNYSMFVAGIQKQKYNARLS
jgi:hypothetical protein